MDSTRQHIAKVIDVTPSFPNAIIARRSDGKEFYLSYVEHVKTFYAFHVKTVMSGTGRKVPALKKSHVERMQLAHYNVPEPTQVYLIDHSTKSIVRA